MLEKGSSITYASSPTAASLRSTPSAAFKIFFPIGSTYHLVPFLINDQIKRAQAVIYNNLRLLAEGYTGH